MPPRPRSRARSTHDGLTLTASYGSPPWAGDVLPPWFWQLLRRRHTFRNLLTAVHKWYEACRAEAYRRFPEVAEAQAAVDACAQEEETLRDVLKAARIRRRTTVPAPDDAAALAAAKARTRQARAWLKALKAEPLLKQCVAQILSDEGSTATWRCFAGRCLSPRMCGRPRPRGERKGEVRECDRTCHHQCPYPTAPRLYDLWTKGLADTNCPEGWLLSMRDLLALRDKDGTPLPVESVRDRIADMIGDGLPWGTLNSVMQSFAVANDRIFEKRAAGQPAELRFHPWAFTGTLVVQIQKGHAQWERLQDRAPWEYHLVGVCKCGRSVKRRAPIDQPTREIACPRMGCDATVELRRATGPEDLQDPNGPPRPTRKAHPWVSRLRLQLTRDRVLEYPVVWDRDIPEAATVKGVLITVGREAGRPVITTRFVIDTPAPPPLTWSKVMHISIQASPDPDGGTTVAKFRTSDAPPLPPGLVSPDRRSTAVVEDETGGRLVLPGAWRKDLGVAELQRSRRSRLIDGDSETGEPGLRAGLAAWLRQHPDIAEATGVTATRLERTRSPRVFARLVPHVPPGTVTDEALHGKLIQELGRWYPPEALHRMSTVALWALRDGHLRQHEETRRAQALARRVDLYRQFACWVARSRCAVDLTVDRAARWVPDVDRADPHKEDRALLQYASPANLAALIEWACKREGVHIVEGDDGT